MRLKRSLGKNDARTQLTSLFGRLVVGLAHQPAVLHQVVLIPRGQLPLAHDAGEAVQVVDEVLRPPHHLCGRDALLTRRALGAESPSVEIRRLRFSSCDVLHTQLFICKRQRVGGAAHLKKSSLQ